MLCLPGECVPAASGNVSPLLLQVTLAKMRSHVSSCAKVQEQMANCPKFVPVVPTSQPIPRYCHALHSKMQIAQMLSSIFTRSSKIQTCVLLACYPGLFMARNVSMLILVAPAALAVPCVSASKKGLSRSGWLSLWLGWEQAGLALPWAGGTKQNRQQQRRLGSFGRS